LKITEDMINSLNISYVVTGSHTQTHHNREYGYSVDVPALDGTDEDFYYVPKKKGVVRTVTSDYPELTTTTIAERVANNRLAFIRRNDVRTKKESDYYNKDKKFSTEN